MQYSKYSHLLDKEYIVGRQDCLTLVLDFYRDIYGIDYPDYARPVGFFSSELNLPPKIATDMQLKTRSLNRNELREGDILAFRCASEYTNHFGIYIGNNLFIHHMANIKSREESLDNRWFRRLTYIYYNDDVQRLLPQKNSWFELLINRGINNG